MRVGEGATKAFFGFVDGFIGKPYDDNARQAIREMAFDGGSNTGAADGYYALDGGAHADILAEDFRCSKHKRPLLIYIS